MASNEHKNLNNDNLHVPLNFSTASNGTVLTKNSLGILEWASQGTINTNIITLRGFTIPANSNYYFPVSMNNNKDLYFNSNYGSATISAANVISVSNMLRTSIFLADKDYTISQVDGWVSGTVTETVTFALVKGNNVTANLSDNFTVSQVANTLTVLEEFTASTYGSNIKVGVVDNTSFTINSLSKGDFLLPMIKSAGGTNDTFFNLTITLNAV
tara:strand:+ start:2650 stop:3291 length:642 start_codon:yes stop_codon:yes gene_type:complete